MREEAHFCKWHESLRGGIITGKTYAMGFYELKGNHPKDGMIVPVSDQDGANINLSRAVKRTEVSLGGQVIRIRTVFLGRDQSLGGRGPWLWEIRTVGLDGQERQDRILPQGSDYADAVEYHYKQVAYYKQVLKDRRDELHMAEAAAREIPEHFGEPPKSAPLSTRKRVKRAFRPPGISFSANHYLQKLMPEELHHFNEKYLVPSFRIGVHPQGPNNAWTLVPTWDGKVQREWQRPLASGAPGTGLPLIKLSEVARAAQALWTQWCLNDEPVVSELPAETSTSPQEQFMGWHDSLARMEGTMEQYREQLAARIYDMPIGQRIDCFVAQDRALTRRMLEITTTPNNQTRPGDGAIMRALRERRQYVREDCLQSWRGVQAHSPREGGEQSPPPPYFIALATRGEGREDHLEVYHREFERMDSERWTPEAIRHYLSRMRDGLMHVIQNTANIPETERRLRVYAERLQAVYAQAQVQQRAGSQNALARHSFYSEQALEETQREVRAMPLAERRQELIRLSNRISMLRYGMLRYGDRSGVSLTEDQMSMLSRWDEWIMEELITCDLAPAFPQETERERVFQHLREHWRAYCDFYVPFAAMDRTPPPPFNGGMPEALRQRRLVLAECLADAHELGQFYLTHTHDDMLHLMELVHREDALIGEVEAALVASPVQP